MTRESRLFFFLLRPFRCVMLDLFDTTQLIQPPPDALLIRGGGIKAKKQVYSHFIREGGIKVKKQCISSSFEEGE